MKKRLIKSIKPRLTGKTVPKKKAKPYIVDAFEAEEMLMIDIYEHREDKKLHPLWRCVLGIKDFINYNYEKEIWNNCKFHNALDCDYCGDYRFNEITKKHDVSEEVEKTIIGFIVKYTEKVYARNVFYAIDSYEDHLNWEKRATAEMRKHKRIQDKMAELPELPKDFKQFLQKKVYNDSHYMFFDEEKGMCSRCGRETATEKNWKHNMKSICPKCRKKVTYKAKNRIKFPKEEHKEILVIQRFRDETVLRYVKTSMEFHSDRKENLEFTESLRTYHGYGIEQYKGRYVHYYDHWTGSDFWNDKMLYGSQVSYGRADILYTNNWEELNEIFNPEWLNMMRKWTDEKQTMPLKDFLMTSKVKMQLIERLWNAGLYKLAETEVKGKLYFYRDSYDQELKKILGISKPMLNWMQEKNAGAEEFYILREAFEDNKGLSNSEIFELASAKISLKDIASVAKNRKIVKTLHYLERAAGYRNLKEKFNHYKDYLSMALNMDYDLENDTVRYPKDLKSAHDKAVSEFNATEADKKKLEAGLKYPKIRAMRSQLEDICGYKDKHYMIVAPRDAGDIIEEGKQLHHCVGGDGYLSRHNDKKYFILFMRKVASKEERYYTIELDLQNSSIRQYYGAYDKKPDKEEVDKFLEKWKRHIKREIKDGISKLSDLYAV